VARGDNNERQPDAEIVHLEDLAPSKCKHNDTDKFRYRDAGENLSG
jgi:hypothetical protein